MIEKSDIKECFSKQLQWIKDSDLQDIGFDYRLGKAFFLLGRVAGLTAQVYEEQTQEKPMRKMFSIECEYDGPEEKNLP